MGKDREENHDIPGSGDMAESPTRSFADLSPKDGYPTRSLPDSPEEIGTQIGRYKLLSVLGEGGFGIVYLAEQKEPIRRQVALKIIKPGMDSKQVISRFEAERQALALLDHPNIARVFDAGATEKGRPYFVMEYVKGESITEYCDRKKLNTEQRLELFIQVCEAIQHAHQKGIIHRDIKPSNILVSLDGDKAVPKVIDFGVAKAIGQPLTERTLFTEQGQLVGTPEYMSPEQAELTSQDIDTRSDIYSLGVLLYELLTGTLPFDPKTLHEAAFDEILRIIRDEDPPRPSTRLLALGGAATPVAVSRRTDVKTLAKRLGKELEWIPLKAMRKERDRRYKTASELADDIRNYLNGNPLIAGPESVAYRARKFARKHTGLLAQVRRFGAVFDFFQKNTLDTNLSGAIWGILFT
jgi:non-specific serine/threonine protein kinase/serine/threonine-protein kinase